MSFDDVANVGSGLRGVRTGSSLRAATALAACLVAGCATEPADASYWAVRRTGDGSNASILARTRMLQAGKPVVSRVESLPVVASQRGGLSLRLRRDAASTQSWTAVVPALVQDVEFAAEWMQRSKVVPDTPAVLTMVFVDEGRSLDISESRSLDQAMVLTLYAPVDTGSQTRLSSTSRAALATLVHELVHVQPPGQGGQASRRQQELRATMFEACYLIDSAGITDRIHLKETKDTSAHPPGYALGSSSEGASDALASLRKVAGVDVVDANALPALRRLRAHCHGFIASESSR